MPATARFIANITAGRLPKIWLYLQFSLHPAASELFSTVKQRGLSSWC